MAEVRKVTTPVFRVSFPAVFEAKPGPDGGEPKFSIAMLFDAEAQKTAEFANMKKLAQAAIKERWGDKVPSNLRNPFRKGEEKPDLEGYGEGIVFVSASSKMKPGVIDAKKNKITDEEAFYAGCYARATVVAYAYDKAGNKGVAFGLNNVQKIRDGESLTGRVAAENDFDEVDTSAWEEESSSGDDFLS